MSAMQKLQINDSNSGFSILRGVNNVKTCKFPAITARTVTQCMSNKQTRLNSVGKINQDCHQEESHDSYNKTIAITKSKVEVPAHNAAKMSDHNYDIKTTVPIVQQTLKGPCFNNSYKSSSATTNIYELKNYPCSRVDTKRIGMAMEKYWCRLQSVSSMQNIPNVNSLVTMNGCEVINFSKLEKNDETKRTNKKNVKSTIKMPVKLTTALDGSMLYCCSECVMAYSSKELLEEHVNEHKEDKCLKDDDCRISVKPEEYFEQHKRDQGHDRPFACHICHKKFKRNEHLKRHVIIHSGDKCYACFRCDKAFSRRDHLVKHLVTHRQENPLPWVVKSTVVGFSER